MKRLIFTQFIFPNFSTRWDSIFTYPSYFISVSAEKIDSDEKSFNISKRGQDEEAEDIAYEMYVDNDVEWEDRRGYDDDETDYQIDLDREEDDWGVEDDL